MKNEMLTSAIILLVILTLFPVFKARAELGSDDVELYYDDGTAEAGYAWTTTPGIYAVRFSGQVPSQFYRVVTVRYFIHSNPYSFKLDIRDKDFQSVFSQVVTPTSVGWFDVSLLSEGIVVKGSFYVAMEYLTILKPYLGADYDDPDGESYEDPWPPARITSLDWMIRVVVSPPHVSASVEATPKTLNTRSLFGRWITAHIELPEGFDVNQIDVSTVKLNGEVQAELRPTAIGDHDNDGISDLMVKFDRANVVRSIMRRHGSRLTITGKVNDSPFRGSDTIRVKRG